MSFTKKGGERLKQSALIRIKGEQQSEEQQDKIDLTTDGSFSFSEEGYTLSFIESEITGMAGVVTEVTYEADKSVTMSRKGSFSTQMFFKLGEQHICRYQTPYGDMELCISTTDIRNEMSQDGGFLVFEYSLSSKSIFLSRHKTRIDVKIKTKGR